MSSMDEKYKTIVADPPWPYSSPKAVVGNAGRGSQDGRAAAIIQANVEQHYSTMTIVDLKNLDVVSLAADNAHLYLWVTNSFLVEGHEIARSWGFKPKTLLTWVKVPKSGEFVPSRKTGYWFRSATEHILFCVRGSLRLQRKDAIATWFAAPRLPHSVKPNISYQLIESCSPEPRLEMFARRGRLGWDSWGNEVKSHIEIGGRSE